jgi:5-methylcytosine-specific restriction protein B
MNTADRSVGHIDYAIRRRFAFVDMQPDKSIIEKEIEDNEVKKLAIEIYDKVAALFNEKKDENDNTEVCLASDFKAKDVQIGHSYFLAKTLVDLKLKLEYEIKPILYEYLKDGVLLENAKKSIDSLSL